MPDRTIPPEDESKPTFELQCVHGVDAWLWNCIGGQHYRTDKPAGSHPPKIALPKTDRYAYASGRYCALPGPCERHIHTEFARG